MEEYARTIHCDDPRTTRAYRGYSRRSSTKASWKRSLISLSIAARCCREVPPGRSTGSPIARPGQDPCVLGLGNTQRLGGLSEALHSCYRVLTRDGRAGGLFEDRQSARR